MELLSCHWRMKVNLDPHNAKLPIGNNFVWVPLSRKWHWNSKVTRDWHSTWVKSQKFANCRLIEANFLPISAILWFALGYAKICALWVSVSLPIVINKIKWVNTENYRPEQQNSHPYSYMGILGINIFGQGIQIFLNTFSLILGCQETVLLHKKASFPFIWRLL